MYWSHLLLYTKKFLIKVIICKFFRFSRRKCILDIINDSSKSPTGCLWNIPHFLLCTVNYFTSNLEYLSLKIALSGFNKIFSRFLLVIIHLGNITGGIDVGCGGLHVFVHQYAQVDADFVLGDECSRRHALALRTRHYRQGCAAGIGNGRRNRSIAFETIHTDTDRTFRP